MLVQLQIENLVLIKQAQIDFSEGFHVFSGETGAGKTAILHALKLLCGIKADLSLIRKGCNKAQVCALFEPPTDSVIYDQLKTAGINYDDNDTLILKRELAITGKNKVFINNQPAQLSMLKQIIPHLLDIVAQHAAQKLMDVNYHRYVLDTFGCHGPTCAQVKESDDNLRLKTKQLNELIDQQLRSKTQHQKWVDQYNELEKAAISSPKEEDTLFQEYEKLSHTQELSEALSGCYFTLQEQDPSLVQSLSQLANSLKRINISDQKFNEICEGLHNYKEGLAELSYAILNYKDQLQENPEKLEEINDRLALLRGLCKQFGPTLNEVIQYHEKLKNDLQSIDNFDQEKGELQASVDREQKKLAELCNSLSKKRQTAAKKLEMQIQKLLVELNLPKASLEVHFTPKSLDSLGQENIEFFLRANPGENPAALKDKVSGGELSRLMLAFKVLLVELESTPTLIFDEVDANLGGETALKVGRLLKTLSRQKQLVVITHLPQVASLADHHFLIEKHQVNDRTCSSISQLNEEDRLFEIERMLGGQGMGLKTRELAKELVQSLKS